MLVIRERMGMHHWWNDSDMGELQYLEENLPQYCCVQYKSHMDRTWAYAVRGRRLPPEQWQCLICDAGNEIPDFTFSIPPTGNAIAVTQQNKSTQLYNIKKTTNCYMFLAVLAFSTSQHISMLLHLAVLLYIFYTEDFPVRLPHYETNIQGEHKVFPWLQTCITRKLLGIETYFFTIT